MSCISWPTRKADFEVEHQTTSNERLIKENKVQLFYPHGLSCVTIFKHVHLLKKIWLTVNKPWSACSDRRSFQREINLVLYKFHRGPKRSISIEHNLLIKILLFTCVPVSF